MRDAKSANVDKSKIRFLFQLGYRIPQTHYAGKWKNELFPTVVIVYIHFPIEMFSGTETCMNKSIRSLEKWGYAIATVGKSSLFINTKARRHSEY